MRGCVAIFVVVCASSLALLGCVEDFPPASSIERTRVIGARVDVEDPTAFCEDGPYATTTAAPRPNEPTTVSFLVVEPFGTAAPSVEWGFAACPSLDISSGLGACAGAPFAIEQQNTASSEVPAFDFVVPDDAALAGIDELLVFGVVCGEGTPTVDLEAPDIRCEPSTIDETKLVLRVPVTRMEPPNCNPPDDVLSLSLVTGQGPDMAWTELGDGSLRCDSLPRIPKDLESIEIAMAVSPDAREMYVPDPEDDAGDEDGLAHEEYQISHFTNGGELDRQFTVFEDDKALDRVEWELPPPELVPSVGLVVRFWFVVRDDRQGTSWTERALCVR